MDRNMSAGFDLYQTHSVYEESNYDADTEILQEVS